MLERQIENETNPRHIRIGLLGPLGAGKSTVSELLAQRWDVTPVTEEFGDNPYLASFYDSPQEYSFRSQCWFLENKVKQLSGKCFDCTEIIDPSFEMDKLYAQTCHKIGWMNDLEWENYQLLYDKLLRDAGIEKPDYNVVISADYETLLARIKQRATAENRYFENWMLERYPEYIKHLSEAVHNWTLENSGSFIQINTTKYDLKNPENHIELNRIDGHVAVYISKHLGVIIPPRYHDIPQSRYDGLPRSTNE